MAGAAFIKLNVKSQLEGVGELPGISFVRGKSEAILVVLVNISNPDHKEYSILHKNTRLPIGCDESWELPSGPECRNILQELGFDLEEQYVNMNQTYYGVKKPVYMTPGASDESITFSLLKKDWTQDQFVSLKNEIAENKIHQFRIFPLDELTWESNDSKTFVAVQLYKMLQHRGPTPAC